MAIPVLALIALPNAKAGLATVAPSVGADRIMAPGAAVAVVAAKAAPGALPAVKAAEADPAVVAAVEASAIVPPASSTVAAAVSACAPPGIAAISAAVNAPSAAPSVPAAAAPSGATVASISGPTTTAATIRAASETPGFLNRFVVAFDGSEKKSLTPPEIRSQRDRLSLVGGT